MNVNGPIKLVAGDFNLDGKLDLAIPNTTTGTLRFSPGKGDGTFDTGSTANLPGMTTTRWVAAADASTNSAPR